MTKVWVVAVSVLLLVYLIITGMWAWALLAEPEWSLKLLGAGMLILPVVGVWALLRELNYGRWSEKLGAAVDPTLLAPLYALPRTASGRADRHAADAIFTHYRTQARSQAGRWDSWFSLALAYDACGDRRRARSTLQQAISLYRAQAIDVVPTGDPTETG